MRRSLLVFVGTVVLFVVAVMFNLLIQNGSSTTTSPATSSAAGANLTTPDDLDSPASLETSQLPGVIIPPTAILYGQSSLIDHLSPSQADKVVSTLDNFIMAHSGLTFSTGVVSIDTQQTSTDSLYYLLDLSNPQASYHISIVVNGTHSNDPDVHFEKVT